MPAPRMLEPVPKLSYGAALGNRVIEGDNLQVMVSLRSQYQGAIDVAYLDPPYNTGKKDFAYSDARFHDPNADADDMVYVNNEDGGRHTKWLNYLGDHGIVIATIWQSIAQIDQRYGRPARDAICAASTAQLFIPPLAEPTSAGYLTELLGEEPVANGSSTMGRQTLSAGHQKAGPPPWLRQIGRGRAILVYRDMPPAVAGRRVGSRITGSPITSGCVRNVATRRPPRAELIVPSHDDIEAVFAERLSVAFRVTLDAKSSSNGRVEDQ